jgi:glutamate racemase
MSAIGVFDSGVGGLSVLKALQEVLPLETFIYVSDAGYAPYGERDITHVLNRSRTIAHYLREVRHVKALVVACNTATAAAIADLRLRYPTLPIIGIEPALKPAAAMTQTRRIGVMATRSTLQSEKFQSLLASQPANIEFIAQACDGLAAAIEQGDQTLIESLCTTYTQALGPFGNENGHIDTLVLGCTHYAFATKTITDLIGPGIQLVEGGIPVARRTRALLEALGSVTGAAVQKSTPNAIALELLTTGEAEPLQNAAYRWLNDRTPVQRMAMGSSS